MLQATATLTSDDGVVQCRKDKSGNNYNVSNTTAGNYPLLRLNENRSLPTEVDSASNTLLEH